MHVLFTHPRIFRVSFGAFVVSMLIGLVGALPSAPPAFAGVGAWTTGGPQGGDLYAIAITPNGGTEFAATGYGGLLKSTNGGLSWAFSNGGIANGNTSLALAVAIQKSSPAKMYMSDNGRIYKSTTGGSTWTSANSGITAGGVVSIAIDQGSPLVVYAATDVGGVFRSANGGKSWTSVSNGLPRRGELNVVRVDPSVHTTIYAAGSNGIYKSTNSGTSWKAVHNGLPYGRDVRDLAIGPANHSVLLAATDAGIYKSTNGGSSWAGTSGATSGGSIYTVVFQPNNQKIAYAGGLGGVFKSTTTGSSWVASSSGIPTSAGARAYALAINPATQTTVFVGLGYPFGMYSSTNSASSWAPKNSGINQIDAVALAPLNSTTFLVGTDAQSAVYKTTNNGTSFTSSSSGIPAWATVIQFEVISPTKVYALTYDGLYVSANGGGSWTLVPGSDSFFAVAFVVDHTDNNHIDLFDYFDGFQVTANGGSNWTPKGPTCFPLATFVSGVPALAMEPTNGSNSVLVTSTGVFTTTDDWGSCSKASGTIPNSLEGVAFDPFQPTTVWVWGSGASKATFGGSFSAVAALSGETVDSLFFNPATSGNILVAADSTGVLESTDGGSSFPAVTNSGLVSVDEFNAVAKAGSTIAVGLDSNSVAVINP